MEVQPSGQDLGTQLMPAMPKPGAPRNGPYHPAPGTAEDERQAVLAEASRRKSLKKQRAQQER
jgi:hypothetical protein